MSWDGKMFDKYRITHTDGSPLKGKKYFVLRLDSDDPVEAARVAAAMRAYKKEPRNCKVRLVWYMLKGLVSGLLTAPIVALLHVYDMTYTFPHEALKGGTK